MARRPATPDLLATYSPRDLRARNKLSEIPSPAAQPVPPALNTSDAIHYLALATDYDGTIADDGAVDTPTLAALERLRAGARHLLLVTGRELTDLQRVMPRLDLFDLVVAENGALLYDPATHAGAGAL